MSRTFNITNYLIHLNNNSLNDKREQFFQKKNNMFYTTI